MVRLQEDNCQVLSSSDLVLLLQQQNLRVNAGRWMRPVQAIGMSEKMSMSSSSVLFGKSPPPHVITYSWGCRKTLNPPQMSTLGRKSSNSIGHTNEIWVIVIREDVEEDRINRTKGRLKKSQ